MRLHTTPDDPSRDGYARRVVPRTSSDTTDSDRTTTSPRTVDEIARIQRLAGNRATCDLMTGGSAGSLRGSGGSPANPRAVQRDPKPTPGTGSAKTPAAPPAPLDYDRDTLTPPAVPPGLTLARIKGELDGMVKKSEITSYAASGVPRGKPAEIFLLALIFAVAKRR